MQFKWRIEIVTSLRKGIIIQQELEGHLNFGIVEKDDRFITHLHGSYHISMTREIMAWCCSVHKKAVCESEK